LHRDIQRHWIYKNSQYLHIWFEMLLNARFSYEPKADVYKGVKYTINRGEFLYSRVTFADRLNIGESVLRKCVDYMIKEQMIEVVSSLGKNKPTIYRVCNYHLYNNSSTQPSEPIENKAIEEIVTQSQPSRNLVATKSQPTENLVATKSQPLKKKDNKVNNEKNEKNDNNVNNKNLPNVVFDSKTIISSYTQNQDLVAAIEDFIEMRKTIKRPLATQRALNGILNKLTAFGKTDDQKIQILDNSIMNSWQGIFELKCDIKTGNEKSNNIFLKAAKKEGTS